MCPKMKISINVLHKLMSLLYLGMQSTDLLYKQFCWYVYHSCVWYSIAKYEAILYLQRVFAENIMNHLNAKTKYVCNQNDYNRYYTRCITL